MKCSDTNISTLPLGIHSMLAPVLQELKSASNISQFNNESPSIAIGDCVETSRIQGSTNSTYVTSFINIVSVQKFAENIQLSQDVNNSTSSTTTLFSHILYV